MLSVFTDVSSGSGSFIGTQNMNSQLAQVQSGYAQSVAALSGQMGNVSWVSTNGDALINQTNSIFSAFQNTLILNPNPTTSTSPTQSVNSQNSYFLQYLLGPIGNTQSLLYNLNLSILSISRMIANLIASLSTAIQQVQSDSTITSSFTTA